MGHYPERDRPDCLRHRLAAGRHNPWEDGERRLRSCRADTLASAVDGIYPDEMLGLAVDPRLETDVADRGTLGLRVYVMGRAPDEYDPSLARFGIDLVDLHRDLVLGIRNTSTQILLSEGNPVGAENDRSPMNLILGRQRNRPTPTRVNQAPDPSGAEQLHARGLIQGLHEAPGAHSRAGRTEVSLVIRHTSTLAAALREGFSGPVRVLTR